MIVGPAMPRPITLMWPGACAFGELLEQDRLVAEGRAAAAVLLRPRDRGVPGLAELALHSRPQSSKREAPAAAAADVLGQVRGDPRAHLSRNAASSGESRSCTARA
jgi:hypothetical protein